MYPLAKPPDVKPIIQDLSSSSTVSTVPRPPTPQSVKPFVIIHDPLRFRIYSTLPAIPLPPPAIQQSFSLSPKRPVKREIWPRDQAIEVHTHLLRLHEQYDRQSNARRVREFTAKTNNFFIFRTLIPADDRTMSDFAEGWYITKSSQPQTGTSGLGRGDDAGGLEDIAKAGREKCREVWKQLNTTYTSESDEE